MWQGFVLLYLLLSSAQDVIDKAAIVDDIRINIFAASFWRTLLYTLFTIGVGLLGWFGPIVFSLHILVLINGVLGAVSSLIWTYFLKRLEITGAVAIGYLSPLLFLAIDASIIKTAITPTEILGIFLLVIGGCSFVFDLRHLRLKKAFSPLVLFYAACSIIFTASEAYAFQFLETTRGMNEITYLASVWGIATVILFACAVWTGQLHHLLHAARYNNYLLKVTLSKSADALTSIFWLKAIAIAPVSKVTALASLYPIILLLIAPLAQRIGIHLREDTRRKTLGWKLLGALCLVVGTVLLS